MNNRTEPADFCPTCGVRRYVPPELSDYVYALPANGWLTHYWTRPNDPESTETRTEELAAWGITKRGEVYPLLTSEKPDAFEDVGDDFAFLVRTSAPRRELGEIRREAHAERERQRKRLERGGTG